MCALGACTLAAATGAQAHGPAASALGVEHPVDATGGVVRLSLGLASRWPGRETPDRFRYLCPAAWGADEAAPPVAVLDARRLVLAGSEAVFAGTADGCQLTLVEVPAWRGQTTMAAISGPTVTIVTRDPDGSRLWHFEPDEDAPGGVTLTARTSFPGVRFDTAWRGADGALRVLSSRPSPTLYGDTPESGRALPLEAWAPQFLGIRWHDPTEAGHWIIGAGIDDGVVALETRDDGRSFVEVLRGETRLHGPVAYADGFVALVDGRWHSRIGRGEVAFEDQGERPWTCLDTVGDGVVVCEARALSRLEGPAAEPTTRPYFALKSLVGIDTSCLDAPMLDVPCTSQWLHFGAESGLVSLDAGVTAPDASSVRPLPPDAGRSDDASPYGRPADAAPGASPSGCTVTPARPGGLPLVASTLLVVVVAFGRRLPRRRLPNR